MDQLRTTFEILAGKGIGPFRLGMTRAQVREIAERELGAEVSADTAADAIGDTGIIVHYDEKGCCQRVSASFGAVPGRYAFPLFGEDLSRAEDESVNRLFKAHWLYVDFEHWGIGVPSAGFWAVYPDEDEGARQDGKLQSVIVGKRDFRALLWNLAWSVGGAFAYVIIVLAGAAAFFGLAGAAREVSSAGGYIDGFTIAVFLLFFLFEWRRIGRWLIQGDLFAAIASVGVNLILAYFIFGAIVSAARQLQLPESQVNSLSLACFVLTVAWLLHMVWKIGRAIYLRASWG